MRALVVLVLVLISVYTLDDVVISSQDAKANELLKKDASLLSKDELVSVYQFRLSTIKAATNALLVATTAENEAKLRSSNASDVYHSNVLRLEKALAELAEAERLYKEAVADRVEKQRLFSEATLAQNAYEKSLLEQLELVTTIHSLMVNLKDMGDWAEDAKK
jgi:hypothetical protein